MFGVLCPMATRSWKFDRSNKLYDGGSVCEPFAGSKVRKRYSKLD
jgi:hypothetical protein